jgi:hypothetical protein
MSRGMLAWIMAPVVLLVGIVTFAVTRSDTSADVPEGVTTSFDVPLGTAAALRRGESVDDVLPQALTLRVGDWLELVNLDDETHRLGPVVARAGETARVRFYEAGRFDAACSVGHDTVVIEVLDR